VGRYKPFIMIGAAIVVALITYYLIQKNYLIQKKGEVKEQVAIETQPVAVAVLDLPWGTELKKEMIKMVPYLKGSLPVGCFSDPTPLAGRIIIYPIKANEPIFESRLAPIDDTSGVVAAMIDPKKRAMAVHVDKVIGVSGFVHPGNRVDVLLTVANHGRDSTPITKIVLQNIPVLAAGIQMERRSQSEKPVPVDVITLELTPEEAEKVAHATTQGRIHLALRNYRDTEEVSTRGATVPILLAGQSTQSRPIVRRVSAQRSAPVVKPSVNFTIEVLRGSERTTKTFKVE